MTTEGPEPVDQPTATTSGNTDANAEPGSGEETTTMSRRRALAFLGVGGTAAATMGGTGTLLRLQDRDPRDDRRGRRGRGRRGDSEDAGRGDEELANRFVRMFDDLEPFAEPSDELREALTALAAPEGILDANDPLEVGPVRLITEPELSPNNQDNTTHTAGVTFLGQFIDHDLTRDAGSTLGYPTSLRRSTNLRSARLDLDSVYGGGPVDSPLLYADDGIRMKLESGGLFEDLPRDIDGSALLGDPRNDENLMLNGLQCAFLMFHNAVADRMDAGAATSFEDVQRVVRLHYQWIVVNQFLVDICGRSMVDSVLRDGRQFYTNARAQMPVEFQGAAFRFGHSIVRPSYRANLAGDDGEAFFAFVFDANELGQPDPNDLTGGRRAPRRFVGWQTFFDFGDGEVRPNKKIDTKMSTPLFRLPQMTIDRGRGEAVGPTSLATRNLLRHITWELPSGQAVAREMAAPVLSTGDLADFGQFGASLDSSTPLWLYILREAELLEDGERLGPVGGRIVAETILGMLDLDPTSYLATAGWRPTLPGRAAGDFDMVDLLTVAGVDPETRGQ